MALADFGFSEFHDCDRSANVFSNLYDKVLCEVVQRKFNRKRIVEQIPDEPNCTATNWIFEKDNQNWFKCCKKKKSLMATGDFMCQHIEPLYFIPPILTGKAGGMKQLLSSVISIFDSVMGTKRTGLSGPAQLPQQRDNQSSDEKFQLCFQTLRPGQYLNEGCYCWKGVEECIDPGAGASIYFL
ncbi:unnamed protein product [Amoebophrya sp. A25]|nr:unnamed protein product [Amoebophrya sp. A25]|eukprot:GSA25T00026133001.1